MLAQIVSLIISGMFSENIRNLINTTEMINVETIKLLMYGAIIIYAIYILVYYIIGKKSFEKGVNVD